jgi:hypothetical protein
MTARLPASVEPVAAAAVVEVYSEWAGPCKSILPTYRKLRLDGTDEE